MTAVRIVLNGWHLIGAVIGFALACAGAYVLGYLDIVLGRCICRSYHRRTGLHVSDCPRFR